MPQVIGREVPLCWKGMVIRAIYEYDKWNEVIVAAKDVQAIGQIQMAFLFKAGGC